MTSGRWWGFLRQIGGGVTEGRTTPHRTYCPYCGADVRNTHLTDPDAGVRAYAQFECGTLLYDDEDDTPPRGRSGLCLKRVRAAAETLRTSRRE